MARPLLIFDWDCTLAEPYERRFYAQHFDKTKQALQTHFHLQADQITSIAATINERGIRLETLFASEKLAREFNISASKLGQYHELVQALNTIDPKGWFDAAPEIVDKVKALRQSHDVVILTNSPKELVTSIAAEVGFDIVKDFDAIYTMTDEQGPPKFIDADAIFKHILETHQPDMSQSWSVGDTAKSDLDPAQKLGLKTAYVDNIGRHPHNDKYDIHADIKTILTHIKP
jgi:FMN phosphatase YigB (HAD superfamily)